MIAIKTITVEEIDIERTAIEMIMTGNVAPTALTKASIGVIIAVKEALTVIVIAAGTIIAPTAVIKAPVGGVVVVKEALTVIVIAAGTIIALTAVIKAPVGGVVVVKEAMTITVMKASRMTAAAVKTTGMAAVVKSTSMGGSTGMAAIASTAAAAVTVLLDMGVDTDDPGREINTGSQHMSCETLPVCVPFKINTKRCRIW
ncbi:uncharacterized protein ABDE67_022113 [Symphorus nematophorus]